MTIETLLIESIKLLKDAHISTAKLDAEVLFADELHKDRSWINAHRDFMLSNDNIKKINSKVKRRLNHEPLAYIRGFQEFYGRKFKVDKTVLVPRPESEQIIDEFKKLQLPDFALVADIGCGSGILGITASLEKTEIRVNMIDIDEKVFNIAKSNARTFQIKAQYYTGDLLEAYPDKYDVLLCNLPYVPVNYPVNKATEHEPKIALFSGSDGLDHFRRLFKQLQTGNYGAPVVITESLPEQHEQIKEIAQEVGFKQTAEKDLVQVFYRPSIL